jgi:glycosyltransferase involved in cell wall biosynthesis
MAASVVSAAAKPPASGHALSRPRIMFIVNAQPESAMGERARSFAMRLAADFEIETIYQRGRLTGALAILRQLWHFRPELCHVFDMTLAGVSAAGLFYHATGTPFVIDTGDAIVPLGRALGRRGLSLLATRVLERYVFSRASCIVVRGSYHQELLSQKGVPSTFIPDGVDVEQFVSSASPPKSLNEPLVIGLIGSPVWVPARQTCYGWELVELVRLLKDRVPRPVRGVLIGEGTGVDILKRRCRDYGIVDRIDFIGRAPYAELPARLRLMDICLSTQTNDIIGQVRTTGKLPLYLGSGRFVLASRVGEAARILPPEMLVEFTGESDPDYPSRLADRIVQLVTQDTDFSFRPECVELARRHFDYDLLAARLGRILRSHIPATS